MYLGSLNRSLHQTLAEEWRDKILAGEFVPGSQLPAEREFCKKYKVSRVTIRRALAVLQEQGLIDRHQGRGSFIRPFHSTARRSAKGSRGIIVYVAWDLEFSDLSISASAIDAVSRERGFTCVAFDVQQGKKDLLGFLNQLDPTEVKAVIWWPMSLETYTQGAKLLAAKGIHLVCIDRQMEDYVCDAVVPDHRGGAYQVARHLVQTWEIPAHYFGLLDHPVSAHDCYLGYEQAMLEAGVDDVAPYLLPITASEVEASREACPWTCAHRLARRYLQKIAAPTAIVCGDDYIAYGLYLAVKEAGWVIGRDIGFTGFQNVTLGTLMEPKLTTAERYRADLAARAAGLAIRRVEGMAGPPLVEVVPVSLIVRGTSQRLPATGPDQSILDGMPATPTAAHAGK